MAMPMARPSAIATIGTALDDDSPSDASEVSAVGDETGDGAADGAADDAGAVDASAAALAAGAALAGVGALPAVKEKVPLTGCPSWDTTR